MPWIVRRCSDCLHKCLHNWILPFTYHGRNTGRNEKKKGPAKPQCHGASSGHADGCPSLTCANSGDTLLNSPPWPSSAFCVQCSRGRGRITGHPYGVIRHGGHVSHAMRDIIVHCPHFSVDGVPNEKECLNPTRPVVELGPDGLLEPRGRVGSPPVDELGAPGDVRCVGWWSVAHLVL